MKSTAFSACLVAAMSFVTAGSVVAVSGGVVPVAAGQAPARPRGTLAAAGRSEAAPRLALPEVCFAPGTSPEVLRREGARRSAQVSSLQARGFQFPDSFRWDSTATDGGGLTLGQVTTLTWNIVPDGTPIASTRSGESSAPSNLRAFLDGIYGSEATWIAHFQEVFNQWGALTGVNYVRELNDDSAQLVVNDGVLGVRADIRIGGHFIDGDFNVLAYNYFPEGGDMVIDTGDVYYSSPGGGLANSSRGFKNILAHEHGHGLGFLHSCPLNNTKLMEPTLSTAFSHAQLDDKLAGWRGYGDNREDNETSGAASDLGALGNGTVNVTELSIDDNGDVDFYKFTVPAGKKASVTLTPIGSTYLAGPQNNDGSCSAGTNFNALTVQNLGVELIDTNGTSVLASATGAVAGVAENIGETPLGSGGTFFVRGFATTSVNNVQGYQLAITIADDVPTMSINDVSILEGNAGTKVLNFTVSMSVPPTGPVSANFTTANGTATTADGDYVADAGVVSFIAGQDTEFITITINGDVRNEANETFLINLSNISGALMGDAQGIGTITNDDPLPTLSVNDATVNEGNAGTTVANFTVTLSAVSGQTVTVTAQTASVTAAPPSDYTHVSTVLTFTPGQTTKPFPVTVIGETVVEPDEIFHVLLSANSNSTIADGTGVGTILSEEKPSRTFISTSGSDLNDCSVQTLPCRHIAKAMTQTAPDGEVIVLTPGEYETAPLSITQGIKITSPSGTVAFVRQPITINAPGGRVVLRGLTLKGAGAGNGITLTAADSVSIEDSTIDRWAAGLRLNNAAASRISMLNTMVRNNTSGVLDTGASALNLATISDSRFEENARGLEILTGTFQVKDSTFSGNALSGIAVGPGVAEITRSEFSLNGTGLETFAGGTARIGRSHVFGNTTGLSAVGGSTLSSYGTNVIRGNGVNTVGTIAVVVEQ